MRVCNQDCVSLIPGPSLAPVFDHLQYTASDQKLEPGLTASDQKLEPGLTASDQKLELGKAWE